MQIVLLAAAVVSFLIGDSSSATVLVLLTIFNAVLGLRQEAKAEESLAAWLDDRPPAHIQDIDRGRLYLFILK